MCAKKNCFQKEIGMARIWQIAGKSTGGKAPRRDLANPAVPKNQATIRALRIILRKYMNRRKNQIFLQPIDPILDCCPDYLDVIKSPMDLGTISDQLDEGSINSTAEFSDKMRLIFTNCVKYNSSESRFAHIANAELRRFEIDISKFPKELKQTRIEMSREEDTLHPTCETVLKFYLANHLIKFQCDV
jgi:hypothetical protein